MGSRARRCWIDSRRTHAAVLVGDRQLLAGGRRARRRAANGDHHQAAVHRAQTGRCWKRSSKRSRPTGGDPFRGYQLPEAVLKLKQGFGRLIRTQAGPRDGRDSRFAGVDQALRQDLPRLSPRLPPRGRRPGRAVGRRGSKPGGWGPSAASVFERGGAAWLAWRLGKNGPIIPARPLFSEMIRGVTLFAVEGYVSSAPFSWWWRHTVCS